MNDEERQSLEALTGELLDAFDRLYDQQATVFETQALLVSTGPQLGSPLNDACARTATALGEMIATGAPDDALNRRALAALQPLREHVADVWAGVWSGMRTNSEMRRLIKMCGGLTTEELAPHLQTVVDSGLTVTEKIIYWTAFKTSVPTQLDPPRAELADLTGVECSVNDTALFHPELGKQADCYYLKQGMALAEALERLVPADFTRRIRVILSVNGSSSTFRFHSIHDGESWVAADLEGYGDEAVATWIMLRR